MKTLNQNNTLVIIPAFNERDSIGLVVDEIHKECQGIDVLVVDDGSSDKTSEILKDKKVFLITHVFNMGIGTSFQTGCQFALRHGYDYVVRMDGDGQHSPLFIEHVLGPLKKNEADIVIGSRFLENSESRTSFFRLVGIVIIANFLMLITRKKVTDPTSGFCAMNKNAFEFFSEDCPDDYPEPEILLYHRELKIKEVPITITKRYHGASSITPMRSIYYMVKVLLCLFTHIFKKTTIMNNNGKDTGNFTK